MNPAEPDITRVGTTPARGLPRVLRAVVLGSVSLGLATAAHLAGGGRLPSAGVLIVAGLLLGLAAVTCTTKRCRFRLLLPVLAIQQVLLHLLFDASTSATACGLGSGAVGMAHPAVTLSCGSSAAMAPMSAPSWAMWVGHLMAVLVAAWLLARGEAWLWGVADRIVRAASAAPARLSERRPTNRDLGQPPVILRSPPDRSPAAPRGPPEAVVL